MEEQPVAFAMYIRSPYSWVASLAYGVSPQPAQAPENSKYGFLYCTPMVLLVSSSGFSEVSTSAS